MQAAEGAGEGALARPRLLLIFQNFPFTPQLLYKDVGAIPYYLSSQLGYETSLAYFPLKGAEITDEDYAGRVRLVSLGFFRSRLANTIKAIWFLLREGRRYGILTLFHDSFYSLVLAAVYKALRPSGTVHIKLDMSHLELRAMEENSKRVVPLLRQFITFLFSRPLAGIYTVESRPLVEALDRLYGYRGRVHYLPNGFHCDPGVDMDRLVEEKENIIITVGRIGSYQKHNELLIEALSMLDEETLSGWKVQLVGPLEDGFRKYMSSAMDRYPHLRDMVVLRGPVYDRAELYKIYTKARVFCLTSRWEGFALVMPEAMYFGNCLVAPDMPSTRTITMEGAVGELFPIGDARALSGILRGIMTGESDLDSCARKSHELIVREFNWKVIAGMFDSLLRKERS